MDGIDIALRAIGAFYLLAGFVAARAALGAGAARHHGCELHGLSAAQGITEGLALARRIKLELLDRAVFALDVGGALVEIKGDDPNAAAT